MKSLVPLRDTYIKGASDRLALWLFGVVYCVAIFGGGLGCQALAEWLSK